jgi:hypothetical protein
MIPIPISVSDIVKICNSLRGFIVECIKAAEKQTGLRRTFEILQGKIDHYVRYMHGYILNPDQLQFWHTALTGCEGHVKQLHENLGAGSSSHLTVMKRFEVALSRKRDLKLAEDLQNDTENLASVYELLVFHPQLCFLCCYLVLICSCSSSICQDAPKISHVREVPARP